MHDEPRVAPRRDQGLDRSTYTELVTIGRNQQAASPAAAPHRWPRSVRWMRAGGALLAVVSCLPMVAMLPGAAATVLSTLGANASDGPWAAVRQALDPVARPLLIVSVLLLVAGSLRCGRAPAAMAAAGGGLLYMSMYVLPGSTTGMAGMANQNVMGATNAPLFYSGLILIVMTFAWSAIRRLRHTCRPAWQRSTRPATAS